MDPGRDVIIQIYGARFEALADVAAAEKFLTETVRETGARILGGPHVYDIKERLESQGETPDPKEPEGVSGVVVVKVAGIVVLSTSHVAIHTWPHRKYAVIQAYSCRDFDPSVVLEVIRRVYPCDYMKVSDVTYALVMPELPVDT